ncbi:Maf family protein [Pseudokordiimonas caeni]|uniref:Maf family protein n=1 Tax=Pseudokordiimonas caeni TaxID=2997908 RepID=UPI0028125435|nr:Maf family protein [Pseudokordiimonas caeni]
MSDVRGVILATGSKTRRAMFAAAGLAVEAVRPPVDEEALKDSLIAEGASPRDIADALAELKAVAVSARYPGALVIGGDQVLVLGDRIISKALDRRDAVAKLKALSGNRHELLSAVVVALDGQPIWRHVDKARLDMRPLSDVFIEDYLDQMGDVAFESAGAYQLEGLGAQLFTRVEGDYFTVLGLPLLPLLDLLRRYGQVPL